MEKVVSKAAKKVGHRELLVDPVVRIIVERGGSGSSAAEISAWLKQTIGPKNPAAQPKFVEWVLTEAGVR